MALIETSALDSSNVNLAFECIIKGKRAAKVTLLKFSCLRNLQTESVAVSSERWSVNEKQHSTKEWKSREL